MRIQSILVTGATGQQGGSTVRELLAHGFKVSALTRNINSQAARELVSQGVSVTPGSFCKVLGSFPCIF